MGARDASDTLSDYSNFSDVSADCLERNIEVEHARLPSSSASKPVSTHGKRWRISSLSLPNERPPPHNLEAEQALLGAILVNNEALDRISGFLSPEHFFDPLHGRIYETLATLIHAGKTATPLRVVALFEDSKIGADYTVHAHIRQLVDHAPDRLTDTIGCAEITKELSDRRGAIFASEEVIEAAYESTVDHPLGTIVGKLEGYIAKLRSADEYQIAVAPYKYIAAEQIPRRPVMYGTEIKGLTVATVGRPGVGKTKLIIAENLSKATGKKLLHDQPASRLKVGCFFLEEAQDDIDRLITGAMDYYRISQSDIEGQLFVKSRDQKLIVATHTRDGLIIARPVVAAVKAFIRENGLNSLTVDPFVKSHGVPENDNGAIDQVVSIWSEIGHETHCAVHLYHHTRKTGGAPITIDDVRGGSAIVGAVRSVRILNAMTTEEAENAGVENAWAYVRVDDGKQNNLPPGAARWFHLQTQELAHGDSAGVATLWNWPDAFQNISVSDLLAVQKAVAAGRYRENAQAKDWVGHAIGQVLGLNPERKDERKRISTMIKTWISNGALSVVQAQDEHRRPKPFVEVGQWANE